MGIHNYLRDAIQILGDEGGDITLLTNGDTETVHDIQDVRWETFGSRRDIVWDQFSLPRYLRRRSFDYYWAPGNNGIPWVSTGRTIKVSTTHDIIPLRLPRVYLYRRPGYALPYLVWTAAAILRSDVLITDSHASANDIHRMFRQRSLVVSPTLSPRKGSVPSAQSSFTIPEGDYLVYTGGMDPRKNVDNLLRALALSLRTLPDLRLVVIGHSTEHLKPLIEELNLTNHVVRTGYVSEDEKFAILRGARAMVYPSLYEGFGLPILEAFDANVPVLTCRNSSLYEVAGDAALYVDPLSPASIAEGIVEIIDDRTAEERRTLGRAQLGRYDPILAQRELIGVFEMNPSTQLARRGKGRRTRTSQFTSD